jgi:hypothetical protein
MRQTSWFAGGGKRATRARARLEDAWRDHEHGTTLGRALRVRWHTLTAAHPFMATAKAATVTVTSGWDAATLDALNVTFKWGGV